jgi:uncharacterized protein YjbI with pentapeptide repeats
MSDLVARWADDPTFTKMLRLKLRLDRLEEPGALRRWFDSAPKTWHYATDQQSFDFRCVDLANQTIGEVPLTFSVLDGGTFSNCVFDRTGFQGSSARWADFSGSRFVVAQMTHFYAHNANFRQCEFDRCFIVGVTPRDGMGHRAKWELSDLSECDFTQVKATKTYFDRCDFRGVDLSQAHFVECDFSHSDLRGAKLHDTVFERCTLNGTLLDDLPHIRQLVSQGDNKDIETIDWI